VRFDSLCFCLWKDRLPHRLHRVCDLEWRLPLLIVSESILELERLDGSSGRRFATPKPPAQIVETLTRREYPVIAKATRSTKRGTFRQLLFQSMLSAMRCDPSSRRGPGREGEVRQGREKGCGREGRGREGFMLDQYALYPKNIVSTRLIPRATAVVRGQYKHARGVLTIFYDTS
jgi:hypothetical protein